MRYILDANVVLRFLLADDAQQSPEARRLFIWAESRGGILRLSAATLAEIAWVLRSFYKVEQTQIAQRLRSVLLHPGVISEPVLLKAVDFYEHHNVDFLDCVLAAETTTQADVCLITFDRDFGKFSSLNWSTPRRVISSASA